MSTPIWIAVTAMAIFGCADLVYKRAAGAGVPPHQLLMVQSWVTAVLVLAYGWASDTIGFQPAALWGIGAGSFSYAGFFLFAASLKGGAVSVNAPIFRLSFCVTAAMAIVLLGEPITPAKMLGLALALVATWLLLGNSDRAARLSRLALARVLLATLLVGVANFLYKLGVQAGATPVSMLLTQMVVVLPLAIGVCAVRDGRIRPVRAAWRYAPMSAVLIGSAFLMMIEALRSGEASIVVPIAQMGFVPTAILGFLLLGEPFTLRKGIGLAVALAALASLAHG